MTLPHIIDAPGVNEAFVKGLGWLHAHGINKGSRGGAVVVAPGPVITVTRKPLERVLFGPMRDANPFFHLFESLWMLAGRNDLPWLAQFNQRMTEFSDDGGLTQPAAYGFRWRKHFHYDQLEAIIKHLSEQPNSRRAVLTMWDAWPSNADENNVWHFGDIEKAFGDGKDVPCNTNCFFQVRDDNFLDMSVQCRSNDAIWGAHGANAVHFSVLLEYMAARLDLAPGVMYQYSFNYHAYPDNIKYSLEELAVNASASNAYAMQAAATTPLFCSDTVGGVWERELAWFMELAKPRMRIAGSHWREPDTPVFTEPFFIGTALPMLRAWRAHKEKDYMAATAAINDMAPRRDWRIACEQWMAKRMIAHDEKMAEWDNGDAI